MNVRIQVDCLSTRRLVPRLALLSLFFGGVAGCAPASKPPVDLVTPTLLPIPSPTPVAPVEATLPSGWESYESQAPCGYAVDHPSEMQGASQGTYSWILSVSSTEPSGPATNFVYVSVIPDGFQAGSGEIYNYNPAETQTLLNMQVGETKSLRENLNIPQGFNYTRLPDTTLSNQAAQTYENTQPWEFPMGTKEISYILRANGCTYLIGGYLDTTGSTQFEAINEERFDQIIATFRLKP
jgi:hypothetical protein